MKYRSSSKHGKSRKKFIILAVSVSRSAESIDELSGSIDQGISRIRRTFTEFERGKLHGSYGKREILQSIYMVYSGWREQDRTEIRRLLAESLSEDEVDRSAHLLELLIRVALPEIKPNVVAIWVEAIRYGEAHHIRPFKLRGFFHVKEGLVRCARLFREGQEQEREAEEIARMDEEDRQAEMRRARRQRRKPPVSLPSGQWSLFD